MTEFAGPSPHILEDARHRVAFYPETMTALLLPDPARPTRRTAAADEDRPPGAKQDRYRDFVKHAGTGLPERSADIAANGASSPESHRHLGRLVLNVSHDCNLRCRYCYADGGHYDVVSGPMSRKVAISAIDWVIQAFGGVNLVQFFGGEPLLNPRLIIEVCEYFRQLHGSGTIKTVPHFGLVTNGTLGDASIIRLFRRYRMIATISIDGPEEINDLLRGKGTFSRADRFALECLEAGDIRTDFECTWTGIHADRGVSVVSLMDFFHGRYGTQSLHVVPVFARAGSGLAVDEAAKLANYEEAARYSVRSLAKGRILANSLSHRVLKAFARKEPNRSYCPAGRGVLSVGADGGLYPCFMFTGNPDFRICQFLENRRSESWPHCIADPIVG
jgi:uncharacterized protein